VGHAKAIPTYIDPWLSKHESIWAAAGHPDAVFSTTFDELIRITGAMQLEVE
jgi:prolyl-tRNA editing enzyme YbaK/EbsC (Cys-tRNA(Pro) deacylase)